jgi:hypothetical protein
VFQLAPQSVYLPMRNRHALFAHEVGHALDPEGGEDDADRAALKGTGVRIGYDDRWPGKGLQVKRNPGDQRLRELERRWQGGGGVEDHARYLSGLIRSGEADPARLWILARMNAPERAAIVMALGEEIPVAPHWAEGIPGATPPVWDTLFHWLLNADIQAELAHQPGGRTGVPRHRLVTRLLALAELFAALQRMWDEFIPEHVWDNVGAIPDYRARQIAGFAARVAQGGQALEDVPVADIQELGLWSATLTESVADAIYWLSQEGAFDQTIQIPDHVRRDALVDEDDLDDDDVDSIYEFILEKIPASAWRFGKPAHYQFDSVISKVIGHLDVTGHGMAVARYLHESLLAWLRGQAPPPLQPPGWQGFMRQNPRRRRIRRNADLGLRGAERAYSAGEDPSGERYEVALRRVGDHHTADRIAERRRLFSLALDLAPDRDPRIANLVVSLILYEANPYAVPGMDDVLRGYYHQPGRNEAIHLAINLLIDGYGIEVIRPDDWDGEWLASYVNTGDTYNLTVIYDHRNGDWSITTYGDFVEEFEREQDAALATNPRLRRNPGRPGDWKDPPPCAPGPAAKKLKHAIPLAKLKGKRVRVHVNLHNGCYVIGYQGRVAGYARSIKLRNVRPRVSLAGWRSCNTTKVRNVHAYIEGELVSASAKKPKGKAWKKITYRCKEHGPCFYYPSTGKTFEGAAEVVFLNKGGRGFAQIEVLAKGQPAKKNPPPCGCRYPGGACECGRVQRWWQEPPPGCSC